MVYSFNKLYFSLVESYNNKYSKLYVHVLYKDNDTEELLDLDLNKPVLPYGYEEKYFEKSLIPFSDVLYRSKIFWGNINLKDVFYLKENYTQHYFRFLRDKGINDISDLEDIKLHKKLKKQR